MILIRHGQSEFNVVFSATRRDPGIRDPKLTEEGKRQAAVAAGKVADRRIRRIIASPYTRALETAHIVADALGVPIEVDPIVGERAAFSCDYGSHPSVLAERWPHLAFDHLGDQWWPEHEESEEGILGRCETFRARMADHPDWQEVAVVTHWGFIRGLTGLMVPNCAVIRIDPTRPEVEAEPLHIPDQPRY